jgi:hypothetical protein
MQASPLNDAELGEGLSALASCFAIHRDVVNDAGLLAGRSRCNKKAVNAMQAFTVFLWVSFEGQG